MSWNRSDLASVVSVLESGSRPKGGASTDSGEIPSLGGENILGEGGVTLEGVKRVPRKFYERLTKGHLEDFDVLINKDGAQTGKVGLYRNENGGPSCINEHLFLIRGNAEKITQEYLYYTLLSQPSQIQIDAQISGSAQPGLKRDFIRGVFAEIPDALPEQSKIAEILSTVDRAIDQTEGLIAKQQRIKTGLMQDLLTRGIDEHGNLRSEETHQFKDSPLGRIPVEWDAPTIDDLLAQKVLSGVQDGNHGEKHPKSRDFVPEGIPFIMASDISGGFVDVEKAKKITENQYLGLRIGFAQPKDVLLSHKASIGFVALVPDSLPRLMLTPQVTYYRVADSSALLPEYLAQFFQSGQYQETLKGLAKQSTRDYIGILAQRKVHIAFPKRTEEQKEIDRILSAQDKRRDALRVNLEKLRSLKTALMQDLLTGKVRVTPLLEKMEAGS
jgi:type I restriction enzyme S subunit